MPKNLVSSKSHEDPFSLSLNNAAFLLASSNLFGLEVTTSPPLCHGCMAISFALQVGSLQARIPLLLCPSILGGWTESTLASSFCWVAPFWHNELLICFHSSPLLSSPLLYQLSNGNIWPIFLSCWEFCDSLFFFFYQKMSINITETFSMHMWEFWEKMFLSPRVEFLIKMREWATHHFITNA